LNPEHLDFGKKFWASSEQRGECLVSGLAPLWIFIKYAQAVTEDTTTRAALAAQFVLYVPA
jgi:hypothetical protein